VLAKQNNPAIIIFNQAICVYVFMLLHIVLHNVWLDGVTVMGQTGDRKVPGSTLSRGTVR